MEETHEVTILEQSLDRMLRWIAAADAKISPILGIETAMLGVLAGLGAKVQHWSICVAIIPAVAATLLFLSLLFLSFCWFPRTEAKNNSLVYFGKIANRTLKDFAQAVHGRTGTDYLDDLTAQCHINAVIAGKKYTWIKRAQVCLYLSIVFWFIAIWQLYQQS